MWRSFAFISQLAGFLNVLRLHWVSILGCYLPSSLSLRLFGRLFGDMLLGDLLLRRART